MLTGMWILAMGEILSGCTATFWELMACRVIEGIGYGVCIGPLGAFQMQWFGENEWAYINTLNTVGSSLGIAAVFWITAPAFVALGSSWALVFRYYGFGCAGIALLWTILGRERRNPAGKTSHAIAARRSSIIGEVIRMRNVILVAIALFTQLCVGQLYTAFLPRYFHLYRGLGLTEASALTAVMPTAGMFAAVVGGLGTGFIRLRKPFLWPIATCTLVGCAAAVTLQDPVMIRLALVLVGIGGTGAGTAIVTLVMELPGMTPQKVGTAMAVVWSFAYLGAFLAPLLGGAMAGAIGLRQVMLASLVLTLIQITSMFLLPETGSGRARERIAVAS
jgi:MFS family permease